MIGLLAALLLGATPEKPACALTALDACANTNQLVWTPGFDAAVNRFFGKARADYFYADGRLATQAIQALGGPPDEPKRLADGSWLFAACRAHSCPEKGAAILSPQGRLLAIGLLNFRCHKTAPKQVDCDQVTHLDVFVRAREPDAERLTGQLDAWAKERTASDRAQFGAANVAAYVGLQVHDVAARGR